MPAFLGFLVDSKLEYKNASFTLFGGDGISEETIDAILDFISNSYIYTEANLVSTGDTGTDLILSFE